MLNRSVHFVGDSPVFAAGYALLWAATVGSILQGWRTDSRVDLPAP